MLKKYPEAMMVTILLLIVEAVYAFFAAFTSYILLSTVDAARHVTLILLITALTSLSELALLFLVLLSASSLVWLYALEVVFLVGLAAINLFLVWQMTLFWKYSYYAVLVQLVTVVVLSLLLMPEATGGFLIALSFLLFLALQSRELKRNLLPKRRIEVEERKEGKRESEA